MILEKKQDKKGAYYRLGMIERTALTLENFASSGFGSRFYTEEFLEGLLARRNEVHAKAGKAFAGMILLSTLLAFFDNIHGTTSVLGLTVDIPPSGATALSVLVSLSLLASVIALIDQLLIDRFVSTLGNRLGIFSFELTLLNYSALNLWASAIVPRHFGLKSGTGHTLVFPIIGLFTLIWGVSFLAFPIAVSSLTIWRVYLTSTSAFEWVLSSFAIVTMAFALSLLISFSLKYKFRPTGTSEPTDPYIPPDFLDLGAPRHKDAGDV